MTDTTRDIHSPANVRPDDYEFEGVLYQGTSEDLAEAYQIENDIFDANYTAQGGDRYEGNYALKGSCDHCGARFAYGAYFRHAPTGHIIVTGHICADETFSLPDRVAVDKRNKARKAEAIKRRREAMDSLRLDTQAAIAYLNDGGLDKLTGGYQGFIADVIRKASQYTLSDRQQDAIVKAHKSLLERENESEREGETPVDAPTGKIEFEGTIISRKWKESAYGTYESLVVKVTTDDGVYKVWLRAPKAISGRVDNGDHVKLRATLEASDDASFAFARRPFVLGHDQVAETAAA